MYFHLRLKIAPPKGFWNIHFCLVWFYITKSKKVCCVSPLSVKLKDELNVLHLAFRNKLHNQCIDPNPVKQRFIGCRSPVRPAFRVFYVWTDCTVATRVRAIWRNFYSRSLTVRSALRSTLRLLSPRSFRLLLGVSRGETDHQAAAAGGEETLNAAEPAESSNSASNTAVNTDGPSTHARIHTFLSLPIASSVWPTGGTP